MSGILINAKRLATTPRMFSAYCKWVLARTLSRSGTKLAVACTSDTKICGWLNFSEYWSFRHGIPQAEKALMERCLNSPFQNKTVAIDIGANLGLFTVTLAGLGYSEIHAFEPVTQTFTTLKANVANNQLLENFRLNCIAVGSKEGSLTFEIFEKSPASNRIVSSKVDQAKSTSRQVVPVTTLDQYCNKHDIRRVDFLKIDVEGMERSVIREANNLVKARCISTILLEVCPGNLERVGNSLHALYDSITQVGYFPHILLESGEVGDVLAIEDLQRMTLSNVVVITEH